MFKCISKSLFLFFMVYGCFPTRAPPLIPRPSTIIIFPVHESMKV